MVDIMIRSDCLLYKANGNTYINLEDGNYLLFLQKVAVEKEVTVRLLIIRDECTELALRVTGRKIRGFTVKKRTAKVDIIALLVSYLTVNMYVMESNSFLRYLDVENDYNVKHEIPVNYNSPVVHYDSNGNPIEATV